VSLVDVEGQSLFDPFVKDLYLPVCFWVVGGCVHIVCAHQVGQRFDQVVIKLSPSVVQNGGDHEMVCVQVSNQRFGD
jgi:hypothetical protein